jgi:endo-1,4-beta-mannosidase
LEDPVSDPFWLGVNYWPARSGMYWWQHFDKASLADDFERIQETGLKIVRVFLVWEDFQPGAGKISTACLDHLVDVAEKADQRGLCVLPCFFTGHMCGMNWLPPWALWARERELPTPVFSQRRVRANLPRNFYEDPEILEAQVLLVREVSGALQGHPAVWAWDLGNSPSSVVTPPDREKGSLWLRVMTEELRSRNETVPITLGMDERNLSEDGGFRPQDAAEHLDFLSILATPYASELSSGPSDARLPSFLAILTQWLGGKDVMCLGLCVPTEPARKQERVHKKPGAEHLVSEQEAAAFLSSALDRLQEAGSMGAMVSFFSDFDPGLWEMPPLDRDVPGRHLGVYRRDRSPKDLEPILREKGSLQRHPFPAEPPSWIDMAREEYESDPKLHIRRLYDNYRDYHSDG